jgi:hypothetical protein
MSFLHYQTNQNDFHFQIPIYTYLDVQYYRKNSQSHNILGLAGVDQQNMGSVEHGTQNRSTEHTSISHHKRTKRGRVTTYVSKTERHECAVLSIMSCVCSWSLVHHAMIASASSRSYRVPGPTFGLVFRNTPVSSPPWSIAAPIFPFATTRRRAESH